MANLSESSTFESGIYQLERTDAVDAGIGGNGVANLQARQLANRTKWLYDTLTTLSSGLTIGEDVQAWDTDLDGLAALSGTGLVRRTGSGSFSTVSEWVNNGVCQGRLTLSSGDPLAGLVSDVTGAATLYFSPYQGNRIALYTGTEWQIFTFTEVSLSLGGAAASTNFDIFIFNNSGTITLERVAWTNNTTRATALTTQNGVYVKTGETNKRYLGTIRTTSSVGQCESSDLRRFVWNYYNRKLFKTRVVPATANWTYSSATFRPLDNNTANRVEFVVGVPEDIVVMLLGGMVGSSSGSSTPVLEIGFNSTSEPSIGDFRFHPTVITAPASSGAAKSIYYKPITGYTFMQALESCQTGTCFFQGGIYAQLEGLIHA